MSQIYIRHILIFLSLAITAPSFASVPLVDSQYFSAEREGRYVIVKLKESHKVLSTSRHNGGQQDSLSYLVNHQSMEGIPSKANYEKFIGLNAQRYHSEVAEAIGISAEQMSLMSTAANMQHLAHARAEFRHLQVDAFVTAGVRGNASRPGDATQWFQGENGNTHIDEHGTINIILLINQPMTAGAQAKAAMVLTEAKSGALQQLAISSKGSTHLATGTGTDQYTIATPMKGDGVLLESASTHLKIGELIGQAVNQAVIKAIQQQNRLSITDTSNIYHALSRFGLNEEFLLDEIQKYLKQDEFKHFKSNMYNLIRQPRLAATAYSYAELLDRLQYGTLPASLQQEVLRDQAAAVAVSVSLKPKEWSGFWQKIEVKKDERLAPFIQAIALGWQEKWK